MGALSPIDVKIRGAVAPVAHMFPPPSYRFVMHHQYFNKRTSLCAISKVMYIILCECLNNQHVIMSSMY